jgi:hypothetical protein
MAIIYSYQKNTVILPTDILLGTTTKILNGKPKNQTKSFTISDLSNYITQNITPNIPTLQQVTDNGNITTNDVKVNQLYLWDSSNGDYGKIGNSDSYFTSYDANGNAIFSSSRIDSSFVLLNQDGHPAVLDYSNLTQTRGYYLPDKPGTIALTSDISTPTLQQVTTEGNTTTDDIILNSTPGPDTISNTIYSGGMSPSSSSITETYNGNYNYYNFSLVFTDATVQNSINATGGNLQMYSIGISDNNKTGQVSFQPTDNFGSSYLQLGNKSSKSGFFKVTNLTNDITLQFPNKATGTYTIATTADIIPTLQQVLDNNHNLTNDNNFQGTQAGYLNTGTQVNAFGSLSAGNNSGINVNAFGTQALTSNTGNQVNAFGYRAGTLNTYNNVNLFGYLAYADADNQNVFSKYTTGSQGGLLGRLSFNNITENRKWELPNASGTIVLTSNIGTWGALNYPTWTTGTPFVKMTAAGTFTLDTNTYLTSINSGQVINALGYTPVTNARTLTINGTAYDLTADRSWNVGTVTSVAALTLGTTGLDISSSVATSTTTPVITLNVPTASATNRGALSSTDWTTFNNKQAALGFTPYRYVNTTSSSSTSSLSETQLLQVTIPANTFSATDFLKFTGTFVKTGVTAVSNIKFKISTSSTMPSGTTGQIATVQIGNTSLFGQINRNLSIKSGNITGFNFTISNFTDNVGSTSAINSQSFDPTVTNYFYVSATMLSISDSLYMNSIQITNI